MNYDLSRGPGPASRPLPSGMPEYIVVELIESQYRGQLQLVARYPLYENGNARDFIDIVVNIPRRRWSRPEPRGGERWWVKPTTMAPQRRLIFAEAYARVGGHERPLTVRTDEEIFMTAFRWLKMDQHYQTTFDGWQVILTGARGICQDEPWLVRIETIDPCAGLIHARSVGPDPRVSYKLPKQVGYVGITPLVEGQGEIEGDVFEYYPGSGYGSRDSGRMAVKLEHKGRLLRLDCSELRNISIGRDRNGKPLYKIVGLVSQNDGHPYLAEFVFIEGELAARPNLPTLDEPGQVQQRTERHRPTVRERSPLEDEDYGMEAYLQEIRENSEPPDYD